MRDASGDVRVTLWEGAALYCSIAMGDHVILSDASVSFNKHYDVKVLNIQFPDMVIVSFNTIKR